MLCLCVGVYVFVFLSRTYLFVYVSVFVCRFVWVYVILLCSCGNICCLLSWVSMYWFVRVGVDMIVVYLHGGGSIYLFVCDDG